jgi:hypothetical protein
MPVIETQLNPRSEAFKDSARAMQALVADLEAQAGPTSLWAVAKPRAPSTWPVASCCRVTASNSCSTLARPSWKWARWPR